MQTWHAGWSYGYIFEKGLQMLDVMLFENCRNSDENIAGLFFSF